MELAGDRASLTLTTRSEPYNGKAIHAESEIESANIRKLVGNTRSNIRSNKVRNIGGNMVGTMRGNIRSNTVGNRVSTDG